MNGIVALLGACAGPSYDVPARVGAADAPSAAALPGPPGDALVLGTTPRNLLVISLDTTRRDRVGLLSDLDTTPNLDAIFSEGVVLADHRSCSNWTAPSAWCAQSGRFHLEDDVWLSASVRDERDPRVDWPPDDAPTLASILSGEGFDTTLVTANPLFSSRHNGTGHGFERELRLNWKGGDDAVERAIRASRGLGTDGERWYFHVHFIDPHSPYGSPRAYWTDPRLECPWSMLDEGVQERLEGGGLWSGLDEDERELARACLLNIYEGDLRFWDERFAELWSHFEDVGLLDDTLVVFWTDHGEAFGEHDDEFLHGATLYDTENRATAAFWANDIDPLRWTGPTTHQDIVPTVLDALEVPPGEHTGRVLGHARHDRVRIAFNYSGASTIPIISTVQADRKLMYWWDGTKRFYDLAADPNEQDDIYDSSDPDVIALWEELQPIVEHTDEVWPGLNPRAVGP